MSALSAAGISIREFARREGLNDKLVRRAITNGFLQPQTDGSLDPVLIGTGWCQRNRRRADAADSTADTAPAVRTAPPPLPTPDPPAPRAARGAPEEPVDHELALAMLREGRATLAEADRIKANALAMKQLLDSQRQAGQLVDIAVAEGVLFSASRAARDSWMNWPARVGPLVAAELGLDADRVTEVLAPHVQLHLEDLGEPEFEVADGPD